MAMENKLKKKFKVRSRKDFLLVSVSSLSTQGEI